MKSPKTDPPGAHLYLELTMCFLLLPILTRAFGLKNSFAISRQAKTSTPYACSLLIVSLYGKQSNAFDRSVKTTPYTFLLSNAALHFSTKFAVVGPMLLHETTPGKNNTETNIFAMNLNFDVN